MGVPSINGKVPEYCTEGIVGRDVGDGGVGGATGVCDVGDA